LDFPNNDEAAAPARRLLLFTGLLLLAAVTLVFGAPLVWFLGRGTAGDSVRMAVPGIAAELIGCGISAWAIDILKKASAQGNSRSLTRLALAVARIAFWGSILLVAFLSLAAFFSMALAFGLSG
jgi:uncharacterized membrane protein